MKHVVNFVIFALCATPTALLAELLMPYGYVGPIIFVAYFGMKLAIFAGNAAEAAYTKLIQESQNDPTN